MTREILIADSDLADQGEFQRIFESTDYRVVFSENSEDAFFSIRLLKPDMVIAGLTLTEKTGFELCEAVKKDPELNHIPVVLLSGVFEDIPEREQKRVGANGVLSKPLVGEEVLTLVDSLVAKEAVMAKEEEVTDRGGEWKSFAEIRNEELSLTSHDEIDEEIIELVDVLEEPEPRMSIDDFVSGSREQLGDEIPPIEPWSRPLEEEAGGVGAEEAPGEEKPKEKELLSGREQIAKGVEEPVAPVEKEAAKGEELFEKIELAEILERVEMLKPALEKEWPSGTKEKAEVIAPEKEPQLRRDGFQETAEIEKAAPPGTPFPTAEAERKPMGFDEFEALLRKDLGIGAVEEEGIEPVASGEPEAEPAERAAAEREPVKEETLEELADEIEALEGKPESLEEAPGPPASLDEFEELLKKEIEPELAQEEGLAAPPGAATELPPVAFIEPPLEEELPELNEEEFPQSLLSELEGEIEEEVLEEGEVDEIEEMFADELEVLKEMEPPASFEAGAVPESAAPPELMGEEMVAPTELPAEGVAVFFEGMKEVIPPLEEAKEVVAPPEMAKEVVSPPLRARDKQIQEVIANGIQVMIGDFITKILPEMTQSILDLTAERIEKMVREIVPELAEKAIREEIQRLQKGDKE